MSPFGIYYKYSLNTYLWLPFVPDFSRESTYKNDGKAGLSHCAILVHSLWLTLFVLVVFRLGAANTQSMIHTQIFSISGALIATIPWLAQFSVATASIILYIAGVCDLSWLIKSESAPTEASAGIRQWSS
ncbi:hypothetical protein PanWU01x14_110140 [Parasponia andersonii]|uniref:Uncharacterized protein n=1 Tax=Parasponia andersonii TaxID=3476 RepID=A0A2P5CZ82_PARAD|nr:hypothetical protein PanWU01x14_110140 [Parasponia andersonii]